MQIILTEQEYESLTSRKLNQDAVRDMSRAKDEFITEMTRAFALYAGQGRGVEEMREYLEAMEQAHQTFLHKIKMCTFTYLP